MQKTGNRTTVLSWRAKESIIPTQNTMKAKVLPPFYTFSSSLKFPQFQRPKSSLFEKVLKVRKAQDYEVSTFVQKAW